MSNILQHPIWTDTGRLPDEKWSKFWQGCSLISVHVLQLECLKGITPAEIDLWPTLLWIRYATLPSSILVFPSGWTRTLPCWICWSELYLFWVATLEPPGRVGHFFWISMLAKAMLCRSTDFPSSDVMVASLSGHSSFQSSLGSLAVCKYRGGGRKTWEIWSHTMMSGRQRVRRMWGSSHWRNISKAFLVLSVQGLEAKSACKAALILLIFQDTRDRLAQNGKYYVSTLCIPDFTACTQFPQPFPLCIYML